MKDFSFYTPPSDNDSNEIESIIRQRRRTIARQQLIYTIILLLIIALICVWLYRKAVYVEFDGYVSLEMRNFRCDEDIYFLRSYVRVGDLVTPGDTLFSYTIADNFFNHTHNDYEPAIVVRNRDAKTDYGLARQDLEVLRVRISELERQLATEDHNIRFGLSDNHNKLRTEQELAEAREQYKALRRKLGVLWNAVNQTNQSMSKLNNNGHGYLRIAHMYDYELLKSLGIVYYSVATDSSIVAQKHVPSNSLTLRGEPIMTLQSLNAKNNNLVVAAYVMPDMMKYVNYHSHAEIIVNDEVSYTGSVMMLGARTEEIPGELRSTLSRDHTASIVVFDIDPDQDIPFWSLTNGVPVRIRINKFRNRKSVTGDYIMYNTTTGVDPETLQHSKGQCLLEDSASVHHLYQRGNDVHRHDNDSTVKPDSTAAQPAVSVAPGNATGPFHVIVASGQDKGGAERQAKALRQKGYKNAMVLFADGRYRVAACSYATKAEAESAQRQIMKQQEFSNAWTLHKTIR